MPRKSKGSTWVLVKVPKWVADEWFDDSKYANETTLGYLTGELANLQDLKRLEQTKIGNSHLIIEKGPGQLDIQIPNKLNVRKLKKNEKALYKHGRYMDQGTAKTSSLIFESTEEFTIGHTVKASTQNLRENWTEGKVIEQLDGDKVKIELLNGTVIIRPKDHTRLTEESQQKAAKCKPIGIIECNMQMQPIMDGQYAKWVASKLKRGKRRHTEAQKTRTLSEKIIHRMKRRKIVEAKKTVKKHRVRHEESQYREMILKAFDNSPFLDTKTLVNLTGQPWAFLRPVVIKMCNLIQGGQFKRHYRLKDEYRV